MSTTNPVYRSGNHVGVIQELYSLLLAHYVLRNLMQEAALLADIAPTRLSFTHALTVVQVQQAVHDLQIIAPSQHERL